MQKPRRILAATMAGALAVGAVFTPRPTQGQSDLLPPPNLLAPARPAPAQARPAATVAAAPINAEDPFVTTLVGDVVEQQVKIAENQKLIDEKLAVIAENLRIARIYVSRAK